MATNPVAWTDGFSVKLPASALVKSSLSRISISKGISSTYNIGRVSFYFGNFAQRFSSSELDFLLDSLKCRTVDTITKDDAPGKRIIFYRLKDGTVTFTNSDSGKVFGIHLQLSEIENLLIVGEVLKFILANLKASDEILKEIMFGTYIQTIYDKFLAGFNTLDSSMSIRENFKEIETIIKDITKMDEIKKEFEKKFNFLITNLLLDAKTCETLKRYSWNFIEERKELVQQVMLYKDYDAGKTKRVDQFWPALEKIPDDFIYQVFF